MRRHWLLDLAIIIVATVVFNALSPTPGGWYWSLPTWAKGSQVIPPEFINRFGMTILLGALPSLPFWWVTKESPVLRVGWFIVRATLAKPMTAASRVMTWLAIWQLFCSLTFFIRYAGLFYTIIASIVAAILALLATIWLARKNWI